MLGNYDHNDKGMEIWLAFKHEKAMLKQTWPLPEDDCWKKPPIAPPGQENHQFEKLPFSVTTTKLNCYFITVLDGVQI